MNEVMYAHAFKIVTHVHWPLCMYACEAVNMGIHEILVGTPIHGQTHGH